MAIYKNSDNRASENSVKVTMGPSSYGIMRPPQGEPIVVSLESLHPGSLTVYWQASVGVPLIVFYIALVYDCCMVNFAEFSALFSVVIFS